MRHKLSADRRDFPDRPGVPPKFYLKCLCGHPFTVKRTPAATLEAARRHLAKVRKHEKEG